MNKELEGVEMLTVFRGRDAITYLHDDFIKHGENATPYKIVQNPSDSAPFVKFTVAESDAVMKHTELRVKIYCHYCQSPTHSDTSCPYQLKKGNEDE